MDVKSKEEIIKFAQKLNSTNLSPLRSGNISLKAQNNNGEGFLITPSGKKYDSLKANDIVFVSLDGISEKNKKPSSEWGFHLALYKNTTCNAVVHAHSKFSVICSCLFKKIPSFHYMIALTGAKDIKSADYALFGSKDLSKNIIRAIKGRKSCLIANHGQITLGDDLESAFELAEEVELLCEHYYYCRLYKKPSNIYKIEMKKVLKKISNYKV